MAWCKAVFFQAMLIWHISADLESLHTYTRTCRSDYAVTYLVCMMSLPRHVAGILDTICHKKAGNEAVGIEGSCGTKMRCI